MAAKRIFSIYSKSSGLEITPETKVNSGKVQSEGRVQLRFFLLKAPGANGEKATQIKFVCEPWEAHDLAMRMLQVHASTTATKEKLIHKFQQGETEIVTTLTIEKWSRDGKSGLGLAVGRGDSFVSVPIGKDSVSRFVFAADVLKFL